MFNAYIKMTVKTIVNNFHIINKRKDIENGKRKNNKPL